MPAIVEEDILTTFAQYAVKSAKAPLPSIHQYLRVAKTIISNSYPLEPQRLKMMIRNTFKKDGQLAPFVTAIDEKIIQKEAMKLITKAIPDALNKKGVNTSVDIRLAGGTTLS
jgi:isopentenyl diphosphate isomerase/L-lactate dehydrogenase-like FMN-dependent dehydrogenase